MGEIDLVARSLPAAQSRLQVSMVLHNAALQIWRMEKITKFDADRATRMRHFLIVIPRIGISQPSSRMILFILEFAVRYLMVPGRVENWVLIVELPARFPCRSRGLTYKRMARIWRVAACQWQRHRLSAPSAGAVGSSFNPSM